MLAGQPIIILRDNVDRTYGSEAQQSNIMAAKAIASAVRTTLGPRGMDKMLVGGSGNIVITNDGATILHEIAVEHPAAKMVIQVAEAQDDEVGDGTTTASILIGALMEEAGLLLTKKIHPTLIAQGYSLGMEKALEILDELAIRPSAKEQKAMLIKVAKTAVTGKSIEIVKDQITSIVVDAVKAVAIKEGKKVIIDEDDIQIKTMVGDHVEDAELVTGYVVDKTRVDNAMPKRVEDAKIALLAQPLEIAKTQTKAKIKFSSAAQMDAFSEQEKETLHEMAAKIKASGATAVFCQKGISDPVQYYLAHEGIYAIRDVMEKDIKVLARATGATVVNKVEDLTEDMLGYAGLIEEMKDIVNTRITKCKNPRTVTILLKGGSQIFVDELERAVYDAARVVQDAMEDNTYVVGGGAVDIELLLRIRDYAETVGGRKQLAIEAFANVFEVIPATLAENSGFDPIDKIVTLKAAHSNGQKYAGLNVFTGEIVDMKEEGVFEPLRVKRQAILSAAESSSLLIRVDDMMISKGGGAPMM